jgi:hypothetical protein
MLFSQRSGLVWLLPHGFSAAWLKWRTLKVYTVCLRGVNLDLKYDRYLTPSQEFMEPILGRFRRNLPDVTLCSQDLIIGI